jgi:hypothetical protein
MALILWRGTPASIVVVVIAVVLILLFVADVLVGTAVVALALTIGAVASVATVVVAIDAVVAAILPGGGVLLPVGLSVPLYLLLRWAWEYHVTTDTAPAVVTLGSILVSFSLSSYCFCWEEFLASSLDFLFFSLAHFPDLFTPLLLSEGARFSATTKKNSQDISESLNFFTGPSLGIYISVVSSIAFLLTSSFSISSLDSLFALLAYSL